MNESMCDEVRQQIERCPESIQALFCTLRALVYASVTGDLEEMLWARLPSYYAGERFVRLIPFADHINIEARAIRTYADELSDYTLTPKFMMKINPSQPVPTALLQKIFSETLQGCSAD